jgi:hypothetical protein
MTETPTASSARSAYPPNPAPQRGSAWAGWLVFAGVLLMVVGAFQAIQGLVAIFQDDFYAVNKNGLVLHVSYTGWGWIMLIIAAANFLAGFGVLKGQMWARIWAICAATISLIANIGFTGAYPVWTVTLIALDVVVIYALCVHWDEMREP